MDLIKKMDEFITKAEEYAVATLLFIMMSAIFIAVMERFLLKMGLTWVEEFARFLSVWAAFVGSGLAVKKGAHIGIEAFVQILPQKVRRVEELMVYAVGLGFSVSICVIGTGFLFKLAASGQMSPAMDIPVTWAYSAVPAGCALMGLHYFAKLATGIAKLRVSAHD